MGSEIWRGCTLKLELAEKTGGAGGGKRGGMSFCKGRGREMRLVTVEEEESDNGREREGRKGAKV